MSYEWHEISNYGASDRGAFYTSRMVLFGMAVGKHGVGEAVSGTGFQRGPGRLQISAHYLAGALAISREFAGKARPRLNDALGAVYWCLNIG